MLLFSAFLFILSVFCVKKLWGFLRMVYLYNKFDGPETSSFIFGHWNIMRQPPEKLFRIFRESFEKYFPHYVNRLCNICILIVLKPEDCEKFMSTSKHSRKSIAYKTLERWLRGGLLLSSGEKWSQRRKILTPAFHFTILKDFVSIFNEKADEFLETLSTKGTEAFDVVPLIQEFSLAAIKETAMGQKAEKGDQKFEDYRKAISGIEYVFNQSISRPWLGIDLIRIFTSIYRFETKVVKTLHDYTETIIRKKMKQYDETLPNKKEGTDDDLGIVNKKRKHMAMLDILIQAHKNGNQIDYEGICEEVDTFTFEGHDTVSSAMSFCLMTIANHPEIQKEVLEEIINVLGEENRPSTYDDLNKMELLERCIKETLRLYPSVHIISRDIDEDTVLSSGLVAPKGALVDIPIFDVHRNPEIYPDPEKFDPDRFLPENCQHRHPFAYIPFSAGPRNCIGQRFAMLEMKVLLSAIIKNFQLIPVDNANTIELRMETILRTTDGIKIKFVPRNQTKNTS